MPGPHAATSACAGDCLAVHLQEGESKGLLFDVSLPISGTIGTYIACPPGTTPEFLKEKKAKRVILWACDVYGPRFINNQLLMDWHASNGQSRYAANEMSIAEPGDIDYLVISPDYFHGEELDTFRSNPGFDLTEWISKFKTVVKDENDNDMDRTSLLLKEWVAKVKEMYGGPDTTYAIVGEYEVLQVVLPSNDITLGRLLLRCPVRHGVL